MSVIKQPSELSLAVFLPDEAIRRARPLPSVEELTIEGLTTDEWNALTAILVER